MERAVFKKADAITVVSPGMERMLDERCPEIHDKVFRIQNTYDAAEFAGDVAPPERRKVEILFVGTFDSRATPPHPFVRGLRRVLREKPQARERLRLRVLGGADMASTRYIRDTLGPASDMMSFEGWATHAEVVQEMQRADALAISVAEGAHWHLTAKVFEYLASRRPILAVVPEGDCRELLRRCGGARVIDPGDEEAMVEALLEMVDTGGIEPDAPRNAEEVARLAATEVARGAARLMDRIVSGGRTTVRRG